jgi:hypothetical protein
MRDYLYLWHEPQEKRLIASGIEFRDFVPSLQTVGGVVLLRHQFDEPSFDAASGLEFVRAASLARLADDDVYGYGDFCWVDFEREASLADLDDPAVAALTFFAHAARPLGDVQVPGLGNRFLFHGHDDGWSARIYYSRWDAIDPIVDSVLQRVVDGPTVVTIRVALQRGSAAFWCRGGSAVECERTEDMDMIQRKYV